MRARFFSNLNRSRFEREQVKVHGIYAYIKRIIEVVFTLIISPLVALIVFIFAVVVKIDSRGPAFYTQVRIGLHGKVFKIYKLRSMRVDAEADTGMVWASKDDPRVTKVGRFIRKVRIDELPQFLNIIKGDMSLIGPRPERPDLSKQIAKLVPEFEKRLVVRPGITGLAQVNGGYDISPAEKLKFDMEYIENFSMSQDVHILMKTVGVILTGSGAR